MGTETIVALLGGGGIAAIISAVVAGLFSKRKLGAEAADIITKAAAGVVTNMQAEIDRQVLLRETLILDHRHDMATMIKKYERQMQDVRDVLQLHIAWDVIAIARMKDVGIEMPPAPPVLPPRLADESELPPREV